MQRKPDYIGIGVMKGATTWAWHQLKDHPEIRMPYLKELHYFDKLEITPEQYLAKFSRIPNVYRTGEITPAYINVPHAPALVKTYCPKVKIFAFLRNPVERAFSHWKVGVWAEHKIPPGTSFSDAFNFGHPWPGPFWNSLQEKGNYLKYLKRWYSFFPEKQIKLFWYDDLVSDPLNVLRELYEWVEVDASFVPEKYDKKYNENHSGYNPVMKEVDRKMALEFYLPMIERLENFTGRDLTSWKS
jgi:hypothetical protein